MCVYLLLTNSFSFSCVAFKINLNMVYPPVEGQSDPILGGTFCKKDWLQEVQQVHLLWNVFNSDECIKSTQAFQPNHICPMFTPVDVEEPFLEVIEKNTDEDQVQVETPVITEHKLYAKDFAAVKDVFSQMCDPTNPPHEFVPRGNKTDKKYLVLHDNHARFLKGEDFDNPPDDKSSYESKGCPPITKVYRLVDGKLIS